MNLIRLNFDCQAFFDTFLCSLSFLKPFFCPPHKKWRMVKCQTFKESTPVGYIPFVCENKRKIPPPPPTDLIMDWMTCTKKVDNDKRKRKVGHFCNRMLKDREISINFNSGLEVILVQSKFDVFYEFNSSQGKLTLLNWIKRPLSYLNIDHFKGGTIPRYLTNTFIIPSG